MAETALLSELVYESSPKGRALLCYQDRIPCVGQDPYEIALALIASRDSKASIQALAGLVRFKLDGALDEDYMSYVVDKRDLVKPAFASLSTDQLGRTCHQEFDELQKLHSAELEGVKEPWVCRDVASVKHEIDWISAILNKGKGTRSNDDEYGEEIRTDATTVRMAENGVLSELAVLRSDKGRFLCSGETKIVCLGPSGAELGLALLCSQHSPTFELALAGLVRYRLGGTLSETYNRCLAEHSPTMKKILASLDPEQLSEKCGQEVRSLMLKYHDSLEGLRENEMCADIPSIKQALADARR